MMEDLLLTSREHGVGSTSVQQAVANASKQARQAEFSFAISAARRAEKRRVHAFVRLLDYMVCDVLHQLLNSSVSDVLSALAPSPRAMPPAGRAPDAGPAQADGVDILFVAPPKPSDEEPEWGGPLLCVTLAIDGQLEEGAGELIIEPTTADFIEHMSMMQLDFVDQVKSLTALVVKDELKNFIERPIDRGAVDLEGLHEMVIGSKHPAQVEAVMNKAHEAMAAALDFLATFAPLRDLAANCSLFSAEALREAYAAGRCTLDDFRGDVDRLRGHAAEVEAIPRRWILGVLELNLEPLVEALQPPFQRCLAEVCTLLPALADEAYTAFVEKVHRATSRLLSAPTSVEEFGEHLEFLGQVERGTADMDAEFNGVEAFHDMMAEYGIEVPAMQAAAYATMGSDYQALREAQWVAETSREKHVAAFRSDLEAQVEGITKAVAEICVVAQHEMVLDVSADQEEVLDYTRGLLERVAQQAAEAERIQRYQRLFKIDVSNFTELEDCSEDVKLRHQLWAAQEGWGHDTSVWLASRLDETDAGGLEDAVQRYNKVVFKLEKGLVPNKVVPQLRAAVNAWREFVPIVAYLGNSDLRERHWTKVNAVLGGPIERGESLTLQSLMHMQAGSHKDAIGTISTEATQEAALQTLLDGVLEKWRHMEFTCNAYKDLKDTYILGGVDEVMALLEDSLMTVGNIQASRFVTGIASEVEKAERSLRVFSDTLDEWLECQRQWLYLETIFSAPDIQRQLPGEAKAFWQVDKTFKSVMRRTRDRPNALQAGTAPGLLETFQRANEALEAVHKNLEDYLETKRVGFPRFYFLSNDELLEIISQTKNPRAVQPHLQKCFDGIRSLQFGDEPGSIDIQAMLSAEGERVAFGKNLRARGSVESWLTSVEASMRASVRALAKKGVKEYAQAERTEWVASNTAQLVIVVSNIFWCQEVESRLAAPDALVQMPPFYVECVDQLAQLTGLVRGRLSALERKSLVALITIDVHNRDIVEQLIDEKAESVGDFAWQMQLRYEWEAEAETIIVRQVQARFEYAYEYLGAQSRLVVTPMTDRCYLTLTGALHLKLGGAPAGPAGTGKTETTKDLGKALGIQCVVFNCGENLDYKFMGKFFSGLAQCGAWACFDEFNRIDIEVLSVVAQQLLVIQNALKSGTERFVFEGRAIALRPTCGVFITMNPGYAGRTELPDNLKALFRPMSMMIPDYALVAEVMLFSEGFNNAKALSTKMFQLYKLASEQLSQQDHYDFGMRALKSVLVMAGSLKRSHQDLDEDIVLIRAMRDSNMPKFLIDDARLFEAIVSDLFPDVVVPNADVGDLQHAVVKAAQEMGLQPVPAFVTKAVQLHETFNVRFGVMLVGPTGGGKSSAARTLQTAVGDLCTHGHKDEGFQKTHTHALNPKSVTMGELYGEYNVLTNEWQDGIASCLIRAAVGDTSPDHHWVLFDGPVDALWVENMNTVLDDNCMLCLPNGERIKLDAGRMRMLFEVADLAVASPATVSRCGMVYVPSEDLGWRPFVRSWVDRLACAHAAPVAGESARPDIMLRQASMAPGMQKESSGAFRSFAMRQASGISSFGEAFAEAEPYSDALIDFVLGLFERFVDPLLAHVRKHCREALPSCDVNLVGTCARLFQAHTHPSGGLELPLEGEELDDGTRIALGYIFAHCAVWAFGGNLHPSSIDIFDAFARSLFDGTANFPGGSGTVFDYRLDASRNFGLCTWHDLVPAFTYAPKAPFASLLVHTVDTVRVAAMLETCLSVGRPLLLSGATGVGKSAVMIDVLERLSRGTSLSMMGRAGGDTGGASYLPVVLNFSAQTSSHATQALVESRLEKKRRQLWGAPAGKQLVLFVDDLNMPAREEFGAQPPLELMRQLLDSGGFYDRTKLFWKDVEGMTMVAACGPPGGGRTPLPPRLARHFTLLCVQAPSESALRSIFGAMLGGFLGHFFEPEVRTRMLAMLVHSAVEVYMRVCMELLPTPAKSHYTFNTRDLSKVFQGLVSIRPAQCPDAHTTLTRLWVHENMRVFHDRLVCDEDKRHFTTMLHDLLRQKFGSKEEHDELFVDQSIHFGDYMRMGVPFEDRVYEEAKDHVRLLTLLGDYLDEYNMSSKAPMRLVFFADAVQHISRIARILRQPRGSVMLVGVGGSGKQSLARFAAFVSEATCVSIELTRNYGLPEFREDLRKMYRLCGIDGKRVAFVFTDNHIVHESFVEDINSLLNSGEITGLFPQDERDRLMADFRPYATSSGIEETRGALWRAFVERVRDNLHLVLAMSPVGGAFRARCRQFPSLINCTTIDWFSAWPGDALLSVSRSVLAGHSIGSNVEGSVAAACVTVHSSVEDAAARFFGELRRRYYVTPKSYLDLLSLYTSLLRDKREELTQARERLLNGLKKLQDTNVVVDSMQAELNHLQPILAAKSIDTEALLVKVESERREAEAIRGTVITEEAEVKLKQAETQLLYDDAQAKLEEVLPAMEAAEKALNALNKSDIVEIRTFIKPPVLVQLTMEGVCILLHEKPDWDTAKKVLGEANFVKRLVDFDKDNISERVVKGIQRIIEDPTFTPEQVAKQSKAAMSMCLWVRAMDTYAKVVKVVEPKRLVLQQAQELLDGVVEPKRLVLRQAQELLDGMNAALVAKQAQLKDIEAKVEYLQAQLQATQDELASLQFQADLSQKRLARAGKLTSALADESVRWQATAEQLGARMDVLVGDVFLAAACISYCGAFTGAYRQALVSGWAADCASRGIPTSAAFSLQATLSSPFEIREWCVQGLPTDDVSIDSAVLVTMGSRWPLMVDPQDQANRWVKAMEAHLGLRVVKASDAQAMRVIESCVRIGTPVLLEDCGEALDPAFDTLLGKQTFMQGTRTLIRLGDADVDYDPKFKFYMTTKMPNPHYLPEVCIRVNLINFTVTLKGLEDQLLGDVVRKERPDLEETKDRLVVSISNDKRSLQDLEDKILKLLRESTGNILDDEVLINTLNNSKATSATIAARVAEAEQTEIEINEARDVYRPVPIRGSLLYFVVADLAAVDPMYQYSLSYFTSLFNRCLDEAEPSGDLGVRLASLLTYTTEFMYRTVCRGLFECHRLLFSFLIAASIGKNAGTVPAAGWDFLLRPVRAPADGARPLPPLMAQQQWLPGSAWAGLLALERTLPQLAQLSHAVEAQPGAWQSFAESAEPDQADLSECAKSLTVAQGGALKTGSFATLLLVKVLCEDRLLGAVRRYVSRALGPKFIESPAASLADIYKDSGPATPIIFILSQGADPTAGLSKFAESKGMEEGSSLRVISLGQGQGPIAESILSYSMRRGGWVVLQNCHLARSWMPSLARIVEELQAKHQRQRQFTSLASQRNSGFVDNEDDGDEDEEGTSPELGAEPSGLSDSAARSSGGGAPQYEVHPSFRLWLTSMPAEHFPVPVLQTGIKVTMEPPQGVRENLRRTIGELSPETLDGPAGATSARLTAWRRLVFACATFHALVQERRRFGPLGWNIRYDFSAEDLDCALQTLRMFVLPTATAAAGGDEAAAAAQLPLGAAAVPWRALRYLTGEINYGGRVTDDNDRRLLMTMLERCYNMGVVETEGYSFTGDGAYALPRKGDHASTLAAVMALPHQDNPAVFGLHANADIAYNLQQSRALLGTALGVQPATGGGGGGAGGGPARSIEEQVEDIAADIQSRLPEALDLEKASVAFNPFAPLPSGHDNSLGIVLAQEAARYNTLLATLSGSLTELRAAMKGQAVMSAELEGAARSLLNNQVPEAWARTAYPSLKPLASWVSNFASRFAALAAWLHDGQPKAFWLPGLFFPQGFLTAALQNHARATRTPIDALGFEFRVLPAPQGGGHGVLDGAGLSRPDFGVLVTGLYLEGARWDDGARALAPPLPRQMTSPLPPMHFLPTVAAAGAAGAAAKTYACPLYKTSVRAGVLSTTGASTNFVLHVRLPCAAGSAPDDCVLSGVAALCALDGDE
ncbi:hypothetical protein FOA52_006501 [Chlamydomonas sp. UWO 241]|nr:hypothetical protein FOA52_006501 [Chlamydomonas sp. UWO 241]